jgi:hypothetical protein
MRKGAGIMAAPFNIKVADAKAADEARKIAEWLFLELEDRGVACPTAVIRPLIRRISEAISRGTAE